MLLSQIPANAKTVHRTAALGTGVFYTVPVGKTLYITCAWCSMIPNVAAPTQMGFGTATEDTLANQDLVLCAAPTGATSPMFVTASSYARRVEGGTQIAISDSGPASGLTVGFIGWLY